MIQESQGPQESREELLARWAESLGQMGIEEGGKVLLSVLVVLLLLLLRFVFLRLVQGRVDEPRTRYHLSKGSAHVAFVLGLVVIGVIWLEWVQTLGTFLGLLSAGLAIALRDLVTNLAGWVFIVLRRPFELGDRIEVDGRRGDVIDIRVFQFTILEIGHWVQADQSTGRVIHLPNSYIFTHPLSNYTAKFEFIWDELTLTVTFESDWARAKALLEGIVQEVTGEQARRAQEAVQKASRSFLIFYRTLTPIVYTSVVEHGVRLTLRYLCPPRARRGTAQAIWERVLDAFGGDPAINFAYPTRRVYHNLLEGKEGARPDPPAWLAEGLRPPGSDLPHRTDGEKAMDRDQEGGQAEREREGRPGEPS